MAQERNRAVIEYLLKKGLNAKEIHEDMVKTDSECAPSYATVKRWVIEFKHGRESLKDNDRCGAPVTVKTPEKISEVLAMVMKDRRFTVRHIGETLGLTSTTVYEILKNDLQMTKVSARWVPRLLTPEQKVIRMNQSRDNLALFNADPEDFHARFVTVDETWVHHFTPESKRSSMQWKHTDSPPPKKAKVTPSAGKVMATVFWDSEGIILMDFLEKGRTVTGQYYSSLLMKLRDAIQTKRRGKLSKGVLFHQDNAPPHKAAVSIATIHQCGFEIVPHPPYSPDLAPSDYHLFPNLKKHIGGTRFADDDDVMRVVEGYFGSLSKTVFYEGINKLRHRWEKCVRLKGDYVEK